MKKQQQQIHVKKGDKKQNANKSVLPNSLRKLINEASGDLDTTAKGNKQMGKLGMRKPSQSTNTGVKVDFRNQTNLDLRVNENRVEEDDLQGGHQSSSLASRDSTTIETMKMSSSRVALQSFLDRQRSQSRLRKQNRVAQFDTARIKGRSKFFSLH